MPAMHFRSVDLPEPLRPTMPKNSPLGIANETPLRTFSSSYSLRRKGWRARSLSVCTWCFGMRNVFSSPSTSIAVCRGSVRAAAPAPVAVPAGASSGISGRLARGEKAAAVPAAVAFPSRFLRHGLRSGGGIVQGRAPMPPLQAQRRVLRLQLRHPLGVAEQHQVRGGVRAVQAVLHLEHARVEPHAVVLHSREQAVLVP